MKRLVQILLIALAAALGTLAALTDAFGAGKKTSDLISHGVEAPTGPLLAHSGDVGKH